MAEGPQPTNKKTTKKKRMKTVSGLTKRYTVLFSMLWSVASFAAVTPYPPYPGAKVSRLFR